MKRFRWLFAAFFPLLCAGCADSAEDAAPITNEIVVQIGETSAEASDAEKTDATTAEKSALARLSFRLYDEEGIPYTDTSSASASFRTALPVLTASDFTSFTLYGSTDGGFAWQNLWASSGTATDALAEFTSAEIAVTEGFWNFRLIAQKGGAKYSGSVGRTEIVSGAENALSFTLSLYALGSDAENSTGGVKISVAYPSSGVSAVTAGLYSLSGSAVSGFAEENLSPTGGIATYEKSGIPAGTYAVVFRFYADSEKTVLLGEWREYAGIASGVTSVSADMEKNTISALDKTYTITYDWNGGGLATGATAQATYTRHNGVTLPTRAQVKKDGWIFYGWYADGDYDSCKYLFAADKLVTEIPADSTENRTFHAQWIPSWVYVSGEGSDTDGNGLEQHPFATLAKAVERINSVAADYGESHLDWTAYISGTVTGTTSISTVSAKSLVIEKEADATSAVLDGGAVSRVLTITNTIPVTIKNVTITNGIGISGGIMKIGAGVLTLDGCTISDNNVSQNGALGVSAGTVTLVNITVSGNKSSSYTNGGVFISGGIVTMKSGTITGNESPSSAGGVYLGAATFILEGGTITGNTGKGANGIGGGVYVANGGTFTMTGGEISSNTAGTNGGGVYVASGGSFTMSGTAVISGNTATTSGGGVYNTGSFTMSGGEISANTASDGYAGGGVYTSGTFTMTGSAIIQGNQTSGASTRGGGILIGGGTTKLGGGTLSGNTAVGSGGAICVKGGTLYVYGSTVIGDTTKTIAATESSYSNKSGASGGAIWSAEGTAVYFGYSDADTKSTWTGGISYNYAATATAELGGGAISVGGSLSMASGTISYNGAKTNGGGVLLNGTVFTLSGGTITGNTATNGGGVSVKAGTLAMAEGTVISGNRATSYGGGVYTTGAVTMAGGKVTANTANTDGGGVAVVGGSCSMSGGEISLNTASGAGGVYVSGTFTMSGTTAISDNTSTGTSAGGVFLNGGTTLFTMDGGKITGNKNTSAGSAGGIGLSGATFTMNDGEISGNESVSYGGAFYDWAGTINIKNGTIKNNTAADGGAVYINGAGAINLSGGTITGNTATGKGGAIYVNISGDPTLTMSESACVTHDNDIYLANGRTITISGALSGTLPVATITPSSYTDGKQVLTGDYATGDNYKKFAVTPNAANPAQDWCVNSAGQLELITAWVAAINGIYYTTIGDVNTAVQQMSGSGNKILFGPSAQNAHLGNTWNVGANFGYYVRTNSAITGIDIIDLSKATGITSIWRAAFCSLSHIYAIILPPNLAMISDVDVFNGTQGLSELVIPASVTKIGAQVFGTSKYVPRVIFENTAGWKTATSGTPIDVTNPDTNATNLQNESSAWRSEGIVRGDDWVAGVNNLYYYSTEEALSAIKNATGTAEIKIGAGATNDDFKGDYAGSTLHWYNLSEGIIGTSADALRIDMSEATSMTAILGYAFIGCSKITSLILPPNITSLGRQSFQGCGGITTLTIPDGVTFLDWATLCDCSALTAITIPASVTTIADLAFWNAGVTSITFAVTSGWQTRTNGTACDVSNPATNAANLKSNTHAWGTEGIKR